MSAAISRSFHKKATFAYDNMLIFPKVYEMEVVYGAVFLSPVLTESAVALEEVGVSVSVSNRGDDRYPLPSRPSPSVPRRGLCQNSLRRVELSWLHYKIISEPPDDFIPSTH